MKWEMQKPVRGRRNRSNRKLWLWALLAIFLIAGGFGAFHYFAPTSVEKSVDRLSFVGSVTDSEAQAVRQAIKDQSVTLKGTVSAHVKTVLEADKSPQVLSVYVPVTNVYAARQAITKADLQSVDVYVPSDTDAKVRTAIAGVLGVDDSKLLALSSTSQEIPDAAVAFIPLSELSYSVKLLAFEGVYYLDSFQKGAIFRQAAFSGNSVASLSGLKLNNLETKDTTLKVNMTGVTALTRVMMKKLASVKDPKYFSQQIGAFLADADITHVSNEVSFKPGCPYSNTSFCAPPEMIETLKDSGIDLVELTGNHNNDTGNQFNTDSINLYHGLGWSTFGGGLNAAEAAKPFVTDKKNSKVAFLGYNAADGPHSGAIAGASTAGANGFDLNKVKADIASAKQSASFVIVDVQYWECYSYPDGFVEYPVCDQPIGEQKSIFRQIAELGADMVIGTQAHQPQTYEIYKGKPIYYGLGNLYFEQTSWPGTERGIILTHYFAGGKLLQTKLSPTVYDQALQTHLMSLEDAVNFLQRLKTARQSL